MDWDPISFSFLGGGPQWQQGDLVNLEYSTAGFRFVDPTLVFSEFPRPAVVPSLPQDVPRAALPDGLKPKTPGLASLMRVKLF